MAIRCGANLLPVKGLLYAMAHAKASRFVTGSSKQDVQISVRKLAKYIQELTDLAVDLQKMQEVSGSSLHREIRLAVMAYVNLFYNMDESQRSSYLESCIGHSGRKKKIPHEQNLLLIPALMASRGEARNDVTNFLSNAIYKIPFRVLYHSSKAAIHIELFQQAAGLKAAPDKEIERFSGLLEKVAGKMDGIEEGKVQPEEDEELKREFIDEAVHISHSTEMKIADFMSEKIMPNAFTDRMARRIIRRL